MRRSFISALGVCLFAGACSFNAQPDVRLATSLHNDIQVSEKNPDLTNLAVQFEAITARGPEDMQLTRSEDFGFDSWHQSLLTDGNVITTQQLASLDAPSVVRRSNRPLFGKSGLAVRITASGSPPVVRFLSHCSSLNFESADLSTHKSRVSCGNSRFTYDWDTTGLKIKKNSRTVYEVMLMPGLYRLDGEVLRVE